MDNINNEISDNRVQTSIFNAENVKIRVPQGSD